MKVYVIYTHPNPESFNRAVLERLVSGLEDAGHEVMVSDLYGDGFSCALTKDDLAGLASGRVAEDVRAYQEKVSGADALAFVFPVWWFGPPALLKGWFDRVFSKGFAYDFGPKGLIPMLKIKKALVISTAGGMEDMYKNLGFSDAMNKVLINGTLQFVGIWNVSWRVFHNVVDCDADTRRGFLDEAYKLGAGF